MAPTRWGIVSTGKVSSDFVNAISLLPQEDHKVKVAAVGARNLSSAEKFAEQFNIPKAYGSYRELADDPDLDVIYVGTITTAHFDVCKLLLEARKNILCEKPLMMNDKQTKIILDMAKERNVFFMEGFWSRFFPVYNKLREALAAGVIGDVKVVKISFGANVKDITFAGQPEIGGGATLAIGGYPVQFAQLVFNEFPQKIVSSGVLTETGIDEAMFTTLHYSGNRVAQLCCHIGLDLPNVAEVIGTKGTIEIPHFWCPSIITIAGEKHEFPLPTATRPMYYHHSEGFTYEAEAVRQYLLNGVTESPLMTHADTLYNMSILTEIYTQCGVVYDV